MSLPTLKVVCFKWQRTNAGYRLPQAVEYDFHHVKVLRNMVARHLHVPYEFICFTDKKPLPKIDGVTVMPLWDKCRYLGGCFNRLYVFSKDMERIIGPRFLCLDLDCVVVDDITPLVTTDVDFKINSYIPNPFLDPKIHPPKDQYYNGAMFLMNAGARAQVWETFDPQVSPRILKQNPDYIGSDQAWIRHTLGKKEVRWGKRDGVYEFRVLKPKTVLPANARIVFFAGNRDPSLLKDKIGWIKDNWI